MNTEECYWVLDSDGNSHFIRAEDKKVICTIRQVGYSRVWSTPLGQYCGKDAAKAAVEKVYFRKGDSK